MEREREKKNTSARQKHSPHRRLFVQNFNLVNKKTAIVWILFICCCFFVVRSPFSLYLFLVIEYFNMSDRRVSACVLEDEWISFEKPANNCGYVDWLYYWLLGEGEGGRNVHKKRRRWKMRCQHQTFYVQNHTNHKKTPSLSKGYREIRLDGGLREKEWKEGDKKGVKGAGQIPSSVVFAVKVESEMQLSPMMNQCNQSLQAFYLFFFPMWI